MADEPAKSTHVSVHTSCERSDLELTAGSEPTASSSGPEASMREVEVPLLACERLD